MLLSAVSVLVVAQSSSEIPEGLMNNPVLCRDINVRMGFSWLTVVEVFSVMILRHRVWRLKLIG